MDGLPTSPIDMDTEMTASQMSLFSPNAGADETAEAEAYNFRLLGVRKLGKTWRDRAIDNIHAIKLAQQIVKEGRPATEAEQEKLIRFVGFGATDLSKLLGAEIPSGWEAIGKDLRRLVSDKDMPGLQRSVQYAHYTPEFMVNAIWKALRRMGFNGGAILEPGMGTGLFLALAPEGIASRSSFLGVEMDATTAQISRLLYPESGHPEL